MGQKKKNAVKVADYGHVCSTIMPLLGFRPAGAHELIEHIDLFMKAIEQIRNKIQFFRILSFDWQDVASQDSDINAY